MQYINPDPSNPHSCAQAIEEMVKNAEMIVQSHERRAILRFNLATGHSIIICFKFQNNKLCLSLFWTWTCNQSWNAIHTCVYAGVKAEKRKLEAKNNPEAAAKAKAKANKKRKGKGKGDVKEEDAVKEEPTPYFGALEGNTEFMESDELDSDEEQETGETWVNTSKDPVEVRQTLCVHATVMRGRVFAKCKHMCIIYVCSGVDGRKCAHDRPAGSMQSIVPWRQSWWSIWCQKKSGSPPVLSCRFMISNVNFAKPT